MLKQSIRAFSSRRLFASTPRSSNLVSDLYVQQIKQFKPSVGTSDASAVKAFKFPAKPAVPSEEINADAIDKYETSEVETAHVTTSSEPAVEEDWFVFEEEKEQSH